MHKKTNSKICAGHIFCSNNWLHFESTIKLYYIYLQCDAIDSCGDYSDEAGCPCDTSAGLYFQCDNGRCIYDFYRCNHRDECRDDSDEKHCSKSTLFFSIFKLCFTIEYLFRYIIYVQ